MHVLNHVGRRFLKGLSYFRMAFSSTLRQRSMFNYPDSGTNRMDSDTKALGLSLIAMVGIVGIYVVFFT